MSDQTPVWSPARLAPLLVLIAGLVAFFALGLDRYLTFDALERHHQTLMALAERYGILANLAYMALYAVLVAFSIPGGALMTLLGGFLFGTLVGGGMVVIGATLGATALFLIARTTLGAALEAKAGPGIRKFEQGFRKNAFSYLLVLRLVPAFPFFLVNLAPAFLGVGTGTYVVTTLLGIIPGTFVYASVGNGLSAVLDGGGTPNMARLTEPDILLPLLALAALSLLPVIYKALRKPDHLAAEESHDR